MNTYEKIKKLGKIIGELVGLYGEFSVELPQLHFVDTHHAISEVKKMIKL